MGKSSQLTNLDFSEGLKPPTSVMFLRSVYRMIPSNFHVLSCSKSWRNAQDSAIWDGVVPPAMLQTEGLSSIVVHLSMCFGDVRKKRHWKFRAQSYLCCAAIAKFQDCGAQTWIVSRSHWLWAVMGICNTLLRKICHNVKMVLFICSWMINHLPEFTPSD